MPTYNMEAPDRARLSVSPSRAGASGAEAGEVPLCPVCDAVLRQTRRPWLARCPSCGFLEAGLSVRAQDEAARAAIDESHRESGLRALRQRNFDRILDRLDAVGNGRRGRLLDVGCAHGWFLEAARARGFDACGIEPDPAICALAQSKGLEVRTGYFPDDIPDGEMFDVIVFNDVFEHLPASATVLRACCRRLVPGGLLAINLPSSRGTFYRLADGLDRCGICGPFERMWQKNFASPHLLYLTPAHLDRLAERAGLINLHGSSLPSVEAAGLWARLRYDRSGSIAAAAIVWLGVVTALPILHLLPADIFLGIYRKPGAP